MIAPRMFQKTGFPGLKIDNQEATNIIPILIINIRLTSYLIDIIAFNEISFHDFRV